MIARGDDDAVSGLAETAGLRVGGRQDPAQPRVGDVDALRVGAVLAAQLLRADGGGAEQGGRNQEQNKSVLHGEPHRLET